MSKSIKTYGKPHSNESTCYCNRLKNGKKCLLCQGQENGEDFFRINGLAAKKLSIVITGTNGKSTITNTLSSILANTFPGVGGSSSTGLYEGGKQISNIEHIASQHYIYLLNKKNTEIIICEQPLTGIWAFGLPIEHDWGIITNITRDHTEMGYVREGMEDIFRLKSTIAAMAKKGVITSIDYPLTRKIIKNFKQKNFFLFGLNSKWVRYYRELGYQVITVKKDKIFVFQGTKEAEEIGNIRDFAICMGGILTYNVENILPIVSVLYNEPKFKAKFVQLLDYLKNFETDLGKNPGRFNVFHYRTSYVVFDYAHNVDGYKKSLESIKNLAKRLKTDRTVALVGIAENRAVKDVEGVAKLIKKYADDYRVRYVEKNENLNLLCKLLGGGPAMIWKEGYMKFIKQFCSDKTLIYVTMAGRGHIADLENAAKELKLQRVDFDELRKP